MPDITIDSTDTDMDTNLVGKVPRAGSNMGHPGRTGNQTANELHTVVFTGMAYSERTKGAPTYRNPDILFYQNI